MYLESRFWNGSNSAKQCKTVQNSAKQCKTVQNSSAVPSLSAMHLQWIEIHSSVVGGWCTEFGQLTSSDSAWHHSHHPAAGAQNLDKKYPKGPTRTPLLSICITRRIHYPKYRTKSLPLCCWHCPVVIMIINIAISRWCLSWFGPQVPIAIGDLTPNNKFFSQIQMASWNDKVWITCSDSDGFLDW